MIDISSLSPEMVDALRALHQAGVRTPTATLNAVRVAQQDVLSFGQEHFYIPETGKPLVWTPVQQILLPIIAGQHHYPALSAFYSTVYWTTPKKMAKTSTSGAYARWRAESSVLNDEVLFFANDETQSRGRAYAAIQLSIELSPLYDRVRRVLSDKNGNPVWRIIEDYIEHIPTSTRIRAVNVDYRGEAGANPSLSVWTEVWGYDSDKQEKLFDEMTDVLTKERSQRYLEGYAGYIGKSKIQKKVEDLLIEEGRQLTVDDIPDWPWPEEHDGLPVYVNEDAGMFGFIDRGEAARKRWPWCVGPEAEQYYARQAITLSPEQYDRLHRNYWITPVTAFLPIEWWNACADSSIEPLNAWREPIRIKDVPMPGDTVVGPGGDLVDAMQMYMDPDNWRVVGEPTPVVLGGDASVSGDCTALVGCTRHADRHQDVVLRFAYKWDPPRGGKLDYDLSVDAEGYSFRQRLIDLCMRYNVVEFAYDEWQLHHLTNELRRDSVTWCRPFSQSRERDIADKQLYDLVKTKRISYNPNAQSVCHGAIKDHLIAASRQQRPKEDTKMHIVKAGEGKIDLVVAISMCAAECLRLDL